MGDNLLHDSGDSDLNFVPPSPPSNTDYRHARWSRPARLQRPHAPAHAPRQVEQAADPRHITVVGVCSAGKSTLSKTLRERGYKVRTVAQEHSHVPYLWQIAKPDVLIYLDASLATIRRRRNPRWHRPLLDEEHRRLSHAREHANLYIHTDGLSPKDVASRALTFLNNTKQVMSDED
ncbi:MAG TPA: hypothetical protein VF952_19905 [Chloroflexia bacterium]